GENSVGCLDKLFEGLADVGWDFNKLDAHADSFDRIYDFTLTTEERLGRGLRKGQGDHKGLWKGIRSVEEHSARADIAGHRKAFAPRGLALDLGDELGTAEFSLFDFRLLQFLVLDFHGMFPWTPLKLRPYCGFAGRSREAGP